MRLAVNLRELRVNKGLSQAAAAKAMGVDSDALARAERGDTTPHPRNALKIAAYYGFQVTDVWPLEVEESAA